jgi:hypothetical protein
LLLVKENLFTFAALYLVKKIFTMKKLLGFVLAAALAACNNGGTHDHDHASAPMNAGDSLYQYVDDAHMYAMGKMGKIEGVKKQVQSVLDSIAKLPEAAQKQAAPLKAQLDSLKAQAEYATYAMDKWMTEFDVKAAEDTTVKRIEYLTNEKLKVDKIKEAFTKALSKADSVFKK